MCHHADAAEFASAHFGSGTGSIYLDSVGCSGSESRLIDCSRNSVVSCSNGHLEDAGVRCQGWWIVEGVIAEVLSLFKLSILHVYAMQVKSNLGTLTSVGMFVAL